MQPAAGRCGRAFDRRWSRTARRGGEAHRPGSSTPIGTDDPHETSTSGGEVPIRVIASTPDQGRLAAVLQRVFRAARQEILITNPYLVPPRPLLDTLPGAARRGITVHLLVPGTSNHPVAGLASEHLQGKLLRSGVSVSQWSGPMLHAKTVVVDRCWSLVGSSNLDSLSLRWNAELDVAVHGSAFGEQMARLFERDLSLAELFRPTDWEEGSWARHWGRQLAAQLSPWL